MLERLGHIDDPKQLITSGLPPLAYFTFDHYADYLKTPRTERLHVLWLNTPEQTRVCISTRSMLPTKAPNGTDYEVFQYLSDTCQLTPIDIRAPWPLSTVKILKPWGAEIWYTGIEARGVSTVCGVPLPWLTDLLPAPAIGFAANTAPLLLKILDPLPDQELGDLYFELHEKKIEVYVVTQVDPTAWPDQVGKIRYGFNPDKRSEYKNGEAFRTAYIKAVAEYKQARATIDEFMDQYRNRDGYALNSEIPSDIMRSWLQSVPQSLTAKEASLKAAMNDFTSLRDIGVGDVITVEPFFPHSLQHGVRVVEFQTASYERHILSFGQKVLTQDHWDTEVGVAEAILDIPEQKPLKQLPATQGCKVELVADFQAFTARRITISPGYRYTPEPINNYQILIGISGRAEMDCGWIEPEAAFFIPANMPKPLTLKSRDGAVLLIAEPR